MTTNFKINEKGFWESENSQGHIHDELLCKALIEFFKLNEINSVVDLGCGTAQYAKSIVNNNIKCDAYDGNPNTKILSNGFASVLDLSNEFDLNKKYDCVLTLEVGEHIPEKYENIFLNNVIKHTNNFIVLSWAVEGQGGDGHVNCKNNDYIINKMSNLGFTHDLKSSIILRNNSKLDWFKNTIMVFKK